MGVHHRVISHNSNNNETGAHGLHPITPGFLDDAACTTASTVRYRSMPVRRLKQPRLVSQYITYFERTCVPIYIRTRVPWPTSIRPPRHMNPQSVEADSGRIMIFFRCSVYALVHRHTHQCDLCFNEQCLGLGLRTLRGGHACRHEEMVGTGAVPFRRSIRNSTTCNVDTKRQVRKEPKRKRNKKSPARDHLAPSLARRTRSYDSLRGVRCASAVMWAPK